jgi:hypothetical protein
VPELPDVPVVCRGCSLGWTPALLFLARGAPAGWRGADSPAAGTPHRPAHPLLTCIWQQQQQPQQHSPGTAAAAAAAAKESAPAAGRVAWWLASGAGLLVWSACTLAGQLHPLACSWLHMQRCIDGGWLQTWGAASRRPMRDESSPCNGMRCMLPTSAGCQGGVCSSRGVGCQHH